MFDILVPVLIYLITAGVKDFFEFLGKPVPAMAGAVIAALVAALILFANSLSALIPQNVLPVVTQLVQLIVLIASAFGIHATVKRIGGDTK